MAVRENGRDRFHARTATLLLLGPISFLMAAASPARCELNMDAQALSRLHAGEVLVEIAADETGEADGLINAAIELPAPPDKVFAVMTDCKRALKFVEHLTVCKVLERGADGSYDIREHHTRWLSILPEMVSVFRSEYIPNREIRFSRVRGDIKFLQGSWRLVPAGGGRLTRLFYHARVGIDLAIPGFMIRSSLEGDIPKLLNALREEVVHGD